MAFAFVMPVGAEASSNLGAPALLQAQQAQTSISAQNVLVTRNSGVLVNTRRTLARARLGIAGQGKIICLGDSQTAGYLSTGTLTSGWPQRCFLFKFW